MFKIKIQDYINENEDELTLEPWQQVKGSLKQLVIASNAVWGVDKDDKIWFRNGSLETEWIAIPGSLSQISTNDDSLGIRVVWGTNKDSQVYFRAGITENNPEGAEWEKVDDSLTFISVGKFDQVWGIDNEGNAYCRQGITEENPKGTKWEKIESKTSLGGIAVGSHTVWGLSSSNNHNAGGRIIYFRTGMTEENPKGDDWQNIDGLLVYATARNNQLWGVNSVGDIWFRKGITRDNLGGSEWQKISDGKSDGELVTISNSMNYIWVINKNDETYCRKVVAKSAEPWKEKGFSDEEIERWKEVGLKTNDWDFATYLKKEKNHNPLKNNITKELREEYYKAQTWLDFNYPEKKRANINELNIANKELTGELDLSDFVNLKALNCEKNQLVSLDLSKCSKIEKVYCSENKLTDIKFSKNNNLEYLDARRNYLTDINSLLEKLKVEKIKTLRLGDNNFGDFSKDKNNPSPLDLTPFSKFINLETLQVFSNFWRQDYEQGIANRFSGSLKPLKNLTKLKWLDIENTDIDSGVEYLPESLENFGYANDQRSEAKVKEIRKNLGSYHTKKWLSEKYPQKEREGKKKLDINEQDLEGKLNLTDFVSLEELDCKDNNLTSLDVSNLINLKRINMSNCPIEGSLKFLESLSKLESLNISNTNLSEGLECLPKECKQIFCNSDYKYKSIKIAEELDKSKCSENNKDGEKYYNLENWRIDKQNSMIASIIPLERLFVIRGNIRQFLKKWGTKKNSNNSNVNNSWYSRLLEKKEINNISELQSPKELYKLQLAIYGTQFIGRGSAVAGAVLTFQNQSAIGGGILAVYPITELAVSKLEKSLEVRESKWKEFLTDADGFLDSYHELLGILSQFKTDDLKAGGVNVALKNLNKKIEFLKDYDEDGNGEIDIEELLLKRSNLTEELNKKEEENKIQGIINSIKGLENEIVNYRQSSYYGTSEMKAKDNSSEIDYYQAEEVEESHQTIDLDKHFEEKEKLENKIEISTHKQ